MEENKIRDQEKSTFVFDEKLLKNMKIVYDFTPDILSYISIYRKILC